MALFLLLLLFLVPPSTVQDALLVVTVRDVQAQPVVGVELTVRSAGDGRVLAEAVTDEDGHATMSGITAPLVRIVASGKTKTGTPLRLSSADAAGIRLQLNSSDATLALRVQNDGLLVIDPTTWAREPVAPHNEGADVQVTPSSIVLVPPTAQPSIPPTAASPAPPLLLLLLLGVVLAALALRSRRAA